jgi:hypothetical protein
MMIWIRIKENGYIMDDIYYEKGNSLCSKVPKRFIAFYDKALRVGGLSPCHDSLDRVAPLSVPRKDLKETEGFYNRRYLKPP